ncbi:MAG: tRNA dihydrouridine synthase DusB [Pseudomonadota bacterium]
MPQIGPYKLPNRVALAPMAGVTDLPFRRLCARMGAGLVVAEMISSNPLLKHSQKTQWRSRHDEEIQPRSVQIAGSEAAMIAETARYNVARGAQIIDINMGCPAKKVCKRAAGSALLANERLVADILNTVVASVDVPVTLKIRTGPEPAKRNGVTIARIAEDAGIAALAVHGRTRACAFKGAVEYDTIADIVRATDFPVFANGDIDDAAKAAAVIHHTGAAGVMIGRAAQGRPWLCGQIATALETGTAPVEPSRARQLTIVLEHVGELHRFYGEFMGLRIARKHVGWYLQNQADYTANRRLFNALETAQQQLMFLQRLVENNENQTKIQKEMAA